jgi:hypothetical protein
MAVRGGRAGLLVLCRIAALALALLATMPAMQAAASGGASMDKLDQTLIERLALAEGDTGRVPVIVTLLPGADPTGLVEAGLAIARRFDALDAVSGSIAVADLRKLAARPEVQLVEYDGEVRALGGP